MTIRNPIFALAALAALATTVPVASPAAAQPMGSTTITLIRAGWNDGSFGKPPLASTWRQPVAVGKQGCTAVGAKEDPTTNPAFTT
jgi:hypothetical protein